MHIALLDQTPYQSRRTLCAEAAARGYETQALIDNLTGDQATAQAACMRAVGDACQPEEGPWARFA